MTDAERETETLRRTGTLRDSERDEMGEGKRGERMENGGVRG